MIEYVLQPEPSLIRLERLEPGHLFFYMDMLYVVTRRSGCRQTWSRNIGTDELLLLDGQWLVHEARPIRKGSA